MCWNAEISLNTFLFSTCAVALATFNGIAQPIEALYYMSFVSMQFTEYLAWRNLSATTAASVMGMGLILVQPALKILTLPASRARTVLLAAYAAFVTLVALHIHRRGIDLRMSKAPNGHLAWHWLKFPGIYLLAWVAFLLTPNLFKRDYTMFAINTIVVSAIYITYIQTNTWGSLWCWIANAYSIWLLYKVFHKSFGARGLCLPKK